jgi:hypothetical protein
MMKLAGFLSPIFVFLLLAGCATFTKARESNLSKLRNGQTQAELIEILGEPKERAGQANWFYDIYSDDSTQRHTYRARFKDGVLTSFEMDATKDLRDQGLREQRSHSNEYLTPNITPNTYPRAGPVTGPNGSPPLGQ